MDERSRRFKVTMRSYATGRTLITATCAVVLMLAGCTKIPRPSEQCKAVWSLRQRIRAGEFPPHTLKESVLQSEILKHAAWCDSYPSGIWL